MDVYYINHLNEKILLDSENVILKYQELFNYSWDADTDNGKITSFTREMATYPITVTVTADSDEEFADILNPQHRCKRHHKPQTGAAVYWRSVFVLLYIRRYKNGCVYGCSDTG